MREKSLPNTKNIQFLVRNSHKAGFCKIYRPKDGKV